jgi:hypothetical protein
VGLQVGLQVDLQVGLLMYPYQLLGCANAEQFFAAKVKET